MCVYLYVLVCVSICIHAQTLTGGLCFAGPSVCGAGPPLPLCEPPSLTGSVLSGPPLPRAGILRASHSFWPPTCRGPPWLPRSLPPWDLILWASCCFGPPCVSLPPFLAPPRLVSRVFGAPWLSGPPLPWAGIFCDSQFYGGLPFFGASFTWGLHLWASHSLSTLLTLLFSASEGFESLSLPVFLGGLPTILGDPTLYKTPLCKPPVFLLACHAFGPPLWPLPLDVSISIFVFLFAWKK